MRYVVTVETQPNVASKSQPLSKWRTESLIISALRDGATSILIERVEIATPADPVGDFHRQRGCCDGTDPNACYKARQERESELLAQSKRKPRENVSDEFEGTD